MSDSQAPPKSEQIPCPLSHLLLALVAVAPAVITVPANLNIVLTAAITVWVGSKRSVKDTPPEESMTRTVRSCSRYQGLFSLNCFDRLQAWPHFFCSPFHFTHLFYQPSGNMSTSQRHPACLPGCLKIPSGGQRCPVRSLHHLQDSAQKPCQPCSGWLLCAAGSPGSDSNTAALH